MDKSDNIKALNKLRSMPRGTQVESRTAGIKALLGEEEVFQTLKMIRWPKGVVCPRCRSSRVKENPHAKAADQRTHYICLDCRDDGAEGGGEFDDFTGLPVDSLQGLTQWMLCWYLVGFCSLAQIADILGLSLAEVAEIAAFGSKITQIPDTELSYEKTLSGFFARKTEKQRREKKRAESEDAELSATSEGKTPFNPKYKSRK